MWNHVEPMNICPWHPGRGVELRYFMTWCLSCSAALPREQTPWLKVSLATWHANPQMALCGFYKTRSARQKESARPSWCLKIGYHRLPENLEDFPWIISYDSWIISPEKSRAPFWLLRKFTTGPSDTPFFKLARIHGLQLEGHHLNSGTAMLWTMASWHAHELST